MGGHDVWRVCLPQCTCAGQRTTLWNLFFPSTFPWALVIDFRPKISCVKSLYLLNHLANHICSSYVKILLKGWGCKGWRGSVAVVWRHVQIPNSLGSVQYTKQRQCVICILYHIKLHHVGWGDGLALQVWRAKFTSPEPTNKAVHGCTYL